MKTYRKLPAFALFACFILFSCRRDHAYEGPAASETNTLSPALMKQWFRETFEKTAEWKTAWAAGKKIPQWEAGVYRKSGNLELLELPLLKQKTNVLVRSDGGVRTSAQSRKLVTASFSRVLFIRNGKKDILIREIEYVPDWDYLQRKGFDLRAAGYGKAGDDFTGTMTVKSWTGKILTRRVLQDGKITKGVSVRGASPAKRGRSSAKTADWQCETVEYCMWYQDCEMQGDVMSDKCTEPYMDPTDCYAEEECSWQPDEDPCATYGACGDGNGGQEEPDYSCAEAQKKNYDQTVEQTVTDNTQAEESSTQIDSLTRNVRKSWKCLNGFGGWSLYSHETGMIKYVPFSGKYRWEWVSLTHHSITKQGSTLPGVKVSYTQGIGTPHVNSLYASMALAFSVTYELSCDCPFIPKGFISSIDKNYEATSPFWLAKP